MIAEAIIDRAKEKVSIHFSGGKNDLCLQQLSAIIHSAMKGPEDYIKGFEKYEALITRQVHTTL